MKLSRKKATKHESGLNIQQICLSQASLNISGQLNIYKNNPQYYRENE